MSPEVVLEMTKRLTNGPSSGGALLEFAPGLRQGANRLRDGRMMTRMRISKSFQMAPQGRRYKTKTPVEEPATTPP